MFRARHGDYNFIPRPLADKIFGTTLAQPAEPVDRTADGDIIFGLGETTGHMHVVVDKEQLIKAERHGDLVTLTVEHPTLIQHTGYEGPRDHNDLQLFPGEWVIVPQREYDPVLDAQSRPVVD